MQQRASVALLRFLSPVFIFKLCFKLFCGPVIIVYVHVQHLVLACPMFFKNFLNWLRP